MADHIQSSLVETAFDMAWQQERPTTNPTENLE